MPTSLDLSPHAVTPGKLVAQDLQRQRDAEEEKRQQAAAAAARTGQLFPAQLAQEQEAAAKATNAGLERTMRADIGVSAQHPELTGKPFAQIDPYYRESLNQRYGPVADKIAPAWEAAQAQNTGGIPGLELHGASMDQSGNVTKSFAAPAVKTENEGIIFNSPDEAEAAGYSAEGAEVMPGGKLRITKMARVDKSRGKFTEAESKSILYLDRMKSAEDGLKAIMKEGYDPTGTMNSIQRGAAGTVFNPIAGETTQRYENEQRNFLAGVLRKDTGAAVTDKEFALYGPMFFPIWGDKGGTVKQKEQKRQVAMDAIAKGLSSDLVIKSVEHGQIDPAKPVTGNPATPAQPSNPAPSGKPKSVRQNGVIYTLQEDGTYR